MRWSPPLLHVLLLAILCLTLQPPSTASPASTPPHPAVPFSRRNSTHPAWSLVSPDPALSTTPPTSAHTFTWLFPHRNLSWMEDELRVITDPSHGRYQEYKTRDEVMVVIGPTEEEKSAVREWMAGHGVRASQMTDLGESLQVTAEVSKVELLFNTSLHRFVNARTNQSVILSLSGTVYVPSSLASSLQRIRGLYDFPPPIGKMVAFRSTPPKASPTSPSPGTPPPSPHHFTPQTTPSTPHYPHHSMHPMQEVSNQCATPLSSASATNIKRVLAPQTLASLYNFTDRANSTALQSTRAMVVSGFLGEAHSVTDLSLFLQDLAYEAPPIVYDLPSPANNLNNLAQYGVGLEANIDIQALYQIAPTNAQNQVYSVPAMGPGNDLDSTLAYIVNLPSTQLPHVVSYSYVFGASDFSFLEYDGGRSEALLLLLGTMGVTVVVSSGDDGATSSYNRGCNPNANSLLYGPYTPFTSPLLPQYPSTSAYVLSVGETAFTYGATNLSSFTQNITHPPECNFCPADQWPNAFLCQNPSSMPAEEPVSVAASLSDQVSTSGGGFSTVIPTPSWQQPQVSGYLNLCQAGNPKNSNGCFLPPSSYFNTAGRGFPDVTAFGGYFSLVYKGQLTVWEGTSVSAPFWAGLMSRLNEVALARSGKPLGFVNPLLYQMAAAQPSTFNDIRVGENFCPQQNTACANAVRSRNFGQTTCSGFFSAQGWDPVTSATQPRHHSTHSHYKAFDASCRH